jgi:hypothetical protein
MRWEQSVNPGGRNHSRPSSVTTTGTRAGREEEPSRHLWRTHLEQRGTVSAKADSVRKVDIAEEECCAIAMGWSRS